MHRWSYLLVSFVLQVLKLALLCIGIFELYFFETEFWYSFFKIGLNYRWSVFVRSFENSVSRLTSIVHLLVYSERCSILKNNHLGVTLILFFYVFTFIYGYFRAETPYKCIIMHRWSYLLISFVLQILLNILFCKVHLVSLDFYYTFLIYVHQNLVDWQLPGEVVTFSYIISFWGLFFGCSCQTRKAKDLKLLSLKVRLFHTGFFESYFLETEYSFFFRNRGS